MLRYLRAHYYPQWRFASRQFLYACRLDLQALKPGNVGLHADGHGKTCRDYRQSAQAAAELITHPRLALGKRIRKAAQATWNVVGCNTNLGVLLLAAPLAEAHYRRAERTLEQTLPEVLEATTVADAKQTYRAIRLMHPGGLGQAQQADVWDKPIISLIQAMTLAAERDRVAAEYARGYPLVVEAQGLWQGLCQRWADPRWAMTATFLTLLARYPDSHIERLHGPSVAAAVSGKIARLAEDLCGAVAPEDYRKRLLDLDTTWKGAGISPGTTADLTLAGVFAARLDGWSNDSDRNMLSKGKYFLN